MSWRKVKKSLGHTFFPPSCRSTIFISKKAKTASCLFVARFSISAVWEVPWNSAIKHSWVLCSCLSTGCWSSCLVLWGCLSTGSYENAAVSVIYLRDELTQGKEEPWPRHYQHNVTSWCKVKKSPWLYILFSQKITETYPDRIEGNTFAFRILPGGPCTKLIRHIILIW